MGVKEQRSEVLQSKGGFYCANAQTSANITTSTLLRSATPLHKLAPNMGSDQGDNGSVSILTKSYWNIVTLRISWVLITGHAFILNA
jgi:hypothetical protein